MKKFIYIAAAILMFGLTSCDTETNEPAGGVATQSMCGRWTVTFEQNVDEYMALFEGADDPDLENADLATLDAMEWEDMLGAGELSVFTHNTAANSTKEMYFADFLGDPNSASFWEFQVPVKIDLGAKTFTATDAEYMYADSEEGDDPLVVNVKYGRILPGAATSHRGAKCDSIIAYVAFNDFKYGFTYLKMSGKRYTGFDNK